MWNRFDLPAGASTCELLMIAELHTYVVADFIPFTAETYLRLIARQNEAHWPAQPLALAMGVAALLLAWRGHTGRVGRARWVAVLLAVAWAWVAVTFHLRLYAELTWAAQYVGWAFLAQAGLMLLWAGFGGFHRGARLAPARTTRVVGIALASVGLAVVPLLGPMTGRGWAGSEWFAITPDPTVIVSMGLALLMARGAWLALLLPVPVLWSTVSGATASVLELPLALGMPAVAGVALAAAVWQVIARWWASSSRGGRAFS